MNWQPVHFIFRVVGMAMALGLFTVRGNAQWEPAGVPFRILEMGNIDKDTVADALYFCGESSLNNDFNFSDGAVPIYRDGQWDTLAVFNGRPQTVARWGDTLVVGGSFTTVNDEQITAIAGFHAGSWSAFGELENFSIYRLKVVGEELFAMGAFVDLDGGPCRGIAKRVSGHWQFVGCLTSNSTIVNDIVLWRDTMYIIGSIKFGGADAPKDVAYFDGQDCVALGPGIKGSLGQGRSLAVYQDQLYVSGSIPIQAGNAGHGIMRWDGEQFHPVGSGLQGADNGYTYLVGAVELEVHDGLLWAGGTFLHAGNVPTPGIATWDGSRWCGLPLGPEPEINTIEFFHDTLFASCHVNLNGVPVNSAVRFTGETYSDTCSLAVGLNDVIKGEGYSLRAVRRADGLVELSGVPRGVHLVEVFDPAGRLLHTQRVQSSGGTPVELALPAVPVGVCMIRVGTAGTVRFIGP